ncbi:MAG TPA: acetate--CoA ligase family protein [Acidimicrobiia bacterium]|nr:acetate--CoA ligase family protein [Acidimicrobiia bacterium]
MARTLSEPESKALLAQYEIPCVPDALVATAADAATAAATFGFPVVVKLAGDRIAHKTERGLVRLALGDETAVLEAGEALLAVARPEDGDVGLLVAPMLRATRELIAGVHDDPQFGRCVMVGIGGVLTEALGDVSFRLVPLSPIDATEMLDDLTSQALLGSVRGEPALDRDAMAQVLLGLSRLAQDRTDVRSVDVNPLLVVDGVPVAVDALVEVAP